MYVLWALCTHPLLVVRLCQSPNLKLDQSKTTKLQDKYEAESQYTMLALEQITYPGHSL